MVKKSKQWKLNTLSLCLLLYLEHWQQKQQQQHQLSKHYSPTQHPASLRPLSRQPGLMSNMLWVTTVLESSQLSQMPNWSLEVLHNAKQHSLKLGEKNK